MPGYRTMQREEDAIDCLICHAVAYDMNRKQVVEDANGLTPLGPGPLAAGGDDRR